jgi:quinol monooxygenase YgiN
VTVKAAELGQARSLLRFVASSTLAESGCRGCRFWFDQGPPARLMLLEEWETPEDLERYFRSPMYQRVLTAMEMGSVAPEVRFLEVTGERGLDWIEQVRLTAGFDEQQFITDSLTH